MTRVLLLLTWTCLLALPVSTAHAQAPWKVVRRYLQPEARVVAETPERLVIEAEGQRLVLAVDRGPDVDVFGTLARNRDGNPYRMWRAMPRLWNDTARPKAAWGRFLRADFLRLIRPPDPVQPDPRASLSLPTPLPDFLTSVLSADASAEPLATP